MAGLEVGATHRVSMYERTQSVLSSGKWFHAGLIGVVTGKDESWTIRSSDELVGI